MTQHTIRDTATRHRWNITRAGLAALTLAVGLAACGDDSEGSPNAEPAVGLAAQSTTDDSSSSEDAVVFPFTVDASLDGYNLIGPYNLSLTEAYCDGLPGCGTKPADVHADIIQGSNGLELQIPNVFTAGLFSINGSLFAVTDSNAILQPCGDVPVNAQISITMFADGVTYEADGSKTLSGIGASLLVAADPAGDCDSGNVFYAAELIPV